ncbi:hypothetical protein [Glycomyces terrestris]|uniref:Uncharacterized protein n=1 Tax=Glycomyces terrestris TaxID=2493553 RepID=A0A426V3G4_9ACTN|nr:hypothetical protein [Glycomyces terrestris]RRS01380.1 hypothetical protein EIW28_00975 [Glycomyces terrestris]
MDYSINFASSVPPARLKALVLARWPLDAEAVFAGTSESFEEHEGPHHIVSIQSGLHPGSAFDTELSAGEAFADVIGGLTELHLATVLCKALETQALIPDDGRADSTWMLVTEDGWHGRVVVDDDAIDDGILIIDHALQPVPTAPDLRVQEPPEWERGWYDDGVVPSAGYLDAD